MLHLTVRRLQQADGTAFDEELQRTQQQLERYDQVVLHLQHSPCEQQRNDR